MRRSAMFGSVVLFVLGIVSKVHAIEVVKEYSLANPAEHVIENDNFEIVSAGAYDYLKPIEVPPPIGSGYGATMKWHFSFENDIETAKLFVPYLIDNDNYDPFAILYIRVSDDASVPWSDWPTLHYYVIGQPNPAKEIDISQDVSGGRDVFVSVTTAYLDDGAHLQLIPSYDKLVLRAELVPETASWGLFLTGIGAVSVGRRSRR